MKPRAKFAAGSVLIAAALAYMIYAGVTQSSVYFVTPSELLAAPSDDKAYRVGALVENGTLRWEPTTLELTFTMTDGKASIPVRHRGTPPDMFGEGRGAVVEGKWMPEGYFRATTILAKHSEEYATDPAPAGVGTPSSPEPAGARQ
jgi:cytochrome c-type biogenesis protein CcmE